MEVLVRAIHIIVTPILYPLLGTVSIIGKLFAFFNLNSKIDQEAFNLLQQILSLRRANRPGWQQEAMTLLRKARCDDPSTELQRLRAMGIMTPSIEILVDRSISEVDSRIGSAKRTQVKVIHGQAMEIKSIYGDTHHVFIHAQGSNWLGLTHLIKELHRTSHPTTPIKHFKFLRPTCKLAKPGLPSAAWKVVRNIFLGPEQITNVREYIGSKWFVFDSDNETREQLLSVDGCFLNARR